MPKDNIERAIAKATQVAGGADFTTMRYEGFSPNKVAVIVEALTDNKNRTASNVRSIFGKRGGAMGETGSVSFNFERIGYIEYPLAVADADKMFEEALEAGANEVVSEEEIHAIETLPDDLSAVTDALEKKFGTPSASRLDWKPTVKPQSRIWKQQRNFWNLLTRWKKTKTFSTFTTMRKLPTTLWLSWRPNNAYPRSGSEHFLYRLGNY